LLSGWSGIDGLASSVFKLVLLPGMDGTGELFSNFEAALPSSLETVRVRYPADDTLRTQNWKT
jgi:hypothetical protein